MGFRRRTRRRALIAGAAIAHHRYNKFADQQAEADAQAQAQYAPPPQEYQEPAASPAPEAPASNDMAQQIQQLAQLHDAGVLTDDEFAAAKTKAIGS